MCQIYNKEKHNADFDALDKEYEIALLNEDKNRNPFQDAFEKAEKKRAEELSKPTKQFKEASRFFSGKMALAEAAIEINKRWLDGPAFFAGDWTARCENTTVHP